MKRNLVNSNSTHEWAKGASKETLASAKRTLSDLVDRAASEAGRKPALRHLSRVLTWGELRRQIDSVARGLYRRGVGPGDVVGWMGDKGPELIMTFLACARIGAVFAPINHKLPRAQLAAIITQAGIRQAVVGHQYWERALSLGAVLNLKRCVFLGGIPVALATCWDDLLNEPARPPEHRAKPDDVVYLNYTSGSTGDPKAAVATHAHIQWNALSTIESTGMTSDDVFMGMFSAFSHPHELFHRTLNLMGTLVLCESWNPRVVAQAIEAHKVTWMMAVPSLYEMMVFRGNVTADLSSLRCLEAGGAYVGRAALEAFEEALGVPFMPVWGSTETTGVAIALPPDGARPDGSIGVPCPYYEVEVRDDEGGVVSVGDVGQLWVRGGGVVGGYRGRPDETERRFKDGWYNTGDLIRQDEEGFCYFVAREAEMLKVGGLRVYPLEVELALAEHSAVRQVAVVGRSDRLRGEVPWAAVSLKEGVTVDVPALRQHCLRHLAVYKVPRGIEIWPELPTLPNGKLDRRAVAAKTQTEGGF